MKNQPYFRFVENMLAGALLLGLTACMESEEDESLGSGPFNGARLSIDAVSENRSDRVWSAATSEMLGYYGESVSPCVLRSRLALGEEYGCCAAAPEAACDRIASLREIKDLIEDEAFKSMSITDSHLGFATVRSKIDDQEPILIEYSGSFMGHYAIIFGYDVDSRELYIDDPYYGRFVVPYGTRFSYGGGLSWSRSMAAE